MQQVTATEKFSVYWNYQVWHLAKGETVSGELADYLLATGSKVEAILTDPPADPDPEPEPDEVPEGTVAEIQAWVGDDRDRAMLALTAELAKGDDARTTLVAALDKLTTGN
jgi:hypothetical protein